MKERFEKQLQSDFPFMQQNRDKKRKKYISKVGVRMQFRLVRTYLRIMSKNHE